MVRRCESVANRVTEFTNETTVNPYWLSTTATTLANGHRPHGCSGSTPAISIIRIQHGYHEVAERVKCPGRNDPKANILELVARPQRDESKGTWLLTLGGLNNNAALLRPQAAVSRAHEG